jgi:hypothetical protein
LWPHIAAVARHTTAKFAMRQKAQPLREHGSALIHSQGCLSEIGLPRISRELAFRSGELVISRVPLTCQDPRAHTLKRFIVPSNQDELMFQSRYHNASITLLFTLIAATLTVNAEMSSSFPAQSQYPEASDSMIAIRRW